jgi:hypothetical protein
MARAIRVRVEVEKPDDCGICDGPCEAGNRQATISVSSDPTLNINICHRARVKLGLTRSGVYKLQFTRDKAVVEAK